VLSVSGNTVSVKSASMPATVTLMTPLVPRAVGRAVSLTVIVRFPAVSRITGTTSVPSSAALKV
jgi:hypothetical protein